MYFIRILLTGVRTKKCENELERLLCSVFWWTHSTRNTSHSATMPEFLPLFLWLKPWRLLAVVLWLSRGWDPEETAPVNSDGKQTKDADDLKRMVYWGADLWDLCGTTGGKSPRWAFLGCKFRESVKHGQVFLEALFHPLTRSNLFSANILSSRFFQTLYYLIQYIQKGRVGGPRRRRPGSGRWEKWAYAAGSQSSVLEPLGKSP